MNPVASFTATGPPDGNQDRWEECMLIPRHSGCDRTAAIRTSNGRSAAQSTGRVAVGQYVTGGLRRRPFRRRVLPVPVAKVRERLATDPALLNRQAERIAVLSAPVSPPTDTPEAGNGHGVLYPSTPLVGLNRGQSAADPPRGRTLTVEQDPKGNSAELVWGPIFSMPDQF